MPAAPPRAIFRRPISWPRSARSEPCAEFAASREELVARIGEVARQGDLVLVMGARDPSLSKLARAILTALKQTEVAAAK